MRILLLYTSLIFAPITNADEFYVVYQWKNEGDWVNSWAVGSVTTDIDTSGGILKLISLLEKERKIESGIVITYLKKIKPTADHPKDRIIKQGIAI